MEDYAPHLWAKDKLLESLASGNIAAAIESARRICQKLGKEFEECIVPTANDESSLKSLVESISHTGDMPMGINVASIVQGFQSQGYDKIPLTIELVLRDALLAMLRSGPYEKNNFVSTSKELQLIADGLSPRF